MIKASESESCSWDYDLTDRSGDRVYDTACGQTFVLNDGTLEDNGIRFCCFCGNVIEQPDYRSTPFDTWLDEEDEDDDEDDDGDPFEVIDRDA